MNLQRRKAPFPLRKYTFRRVTRFVIFGEPSQVLVFDPWHPILVLLVVPLGDPLVICFALLLLGGERVEGRFLLLVGHGVPFLAAFGGAILSA